MGVVKITFDGSSVSAKQDADLNHFLCGAVPAGIMGELANGLTYTVSNNYITFKSGYVQIYGRRIFIEENTQVYIALDGVRYGYIIIDVDLATNSVIINKLETTSSSYPSLIQQNLLTNGTRFQFPIAKYSKTTSLITLQSFSRTVISTPLSVAQSGYNDARNYMENHFSMDVKTHPDQSTGNTYKYNLSAYQTNKILIVVCINSSVMLTIPGRFLTGHSSFGCYYRYLGHDLMLTGEWLSGTTFVVSPGESSQTVTAIYIYKFGA